MKVIATKTGFDGKRVRNVGDEFEMPEGSKGSWFVPAQKAEVKKPKTPAPSSDDLV